MRKRRERGEGVELVAGGDDSGQEEDGWECFSPSLAPTAGPGPQPPVHNITA